MAKHLRRRLVVDADVARASGGVDATYPKAKNCRDFLSLMLEMRHRLVLTKPITAEWRKHASQFATEWRSQMTSRGLIESISADLTDDVLRGQVHQHAQKVSDTRVTEMLKDTHLLEAAQITDRTIASVEVRSRKWFAELSQSSVATLKSIVWVNPDEADEKPLAWLRSGAKSDKVRRLGNYKP